MGALAFLLTYLPQIPQYVAAGTALVDAISVGVSKAEQLQSENREPTAADWDEVNASIAAKRTRLHAPGS
jgi:hypothetical protein